VKERDLDGVQRIVFKMAGFDEKFIDTALSTPNSEMWRPTADALIKARVVTSLSDGLQYMPKDGAADRLSKALPIFEILKTRFPMEFNELVDEYQDGVVKGKVESYVVQQTRLRLVALIVSKIPLADDDVLADYNKLLVDEYTALGFKNPTSCYLYATEGDPKGTLHKEFPQGLQQREQAIHERVLRTAGMRQNIKASDVQPIYDKVNDQLVAHGATDEDFALLGPGKLDASKHAAYCNFATSFFRELSKLPAGESALAMRHIMKK